MTTRLRHLSSELAELYDSATPAQRKEAAIEACSVAIDQTGFSDDLVDRAMQLLRTRVGAPSQVLVAVSLAEKQFDDRYFDLTDEGRSKRPEARINFIRARIMGSLRFALGGSKMDEAIYEAASTVSPEEPLLAAVRKKLTPAE